MIESDIRSSYTVLKAVNGLVRYLSDARAGASI